VRGWARRLSTPPIKYYLHIGKNGLYFAKLQGSDMDVLIPHIEDNVPLPKNAQEAFPDLSPTEELNMRANVVQLLSDLTGQPIAPTKENAEEAQVLAKEMLSNPGVRPDFSKYPNETLALMAGMVAQMNVSVVNELSELKMYVVNSLIQEIQVSKDSKTRIAALKALGEVDGVDAFKKRTETTIKVQTMEEVQKELLDLLNEVETKYIDVEAKEVIKQEKNDK
jgi:hypothetical protein